MSILVIVTLATYQTNLKISWLKLMQVYSLTTEQCTVGVSPLGSFPAGGELGTQVPSFWCLLIINPWFLRFPWSLGPGQASRNERRAQRFRWRFLWVRPRSCTVVTTYTLRPRRQSFGHAWLWRTQECSGTKCMGPTIRGLPPCAQFQDTKPIHVCSWLVVFTCSWSSLNVWWSLASKTYMWGFLEA